MIQWTVDIVGTGNVAFHFAKAIQASPHRFNRLYSRSREQAENFLTNANLSARVSCGPHYLFEADFVLLCVSDAAIANVVETHSYAPSSIVVHCSGATDLSLFRDAAIARHGVIYPYQTLTKGSHLPMSEVPLLVEGGTELDLQQIQNLARSMSDKVKPISSSQRIRLNIAAVFATNFSNAMYGIAEELLADMGEEFEMIHHLITGATDKALALGPGKAQTGPAVRGDTKTIEKHLNSISDEGLKEIYRVISKRISNTKAHQL